LTLDSAGDSNKTTMALKALVKLAKENEIIPKIISSDQLNYIYNYIMKLKTDKVFGRRNNREELLNMHKG
jgi:hypothetical protein